MRMRHYLYFVVGMLVLSCTPCAISEKQNEYTDETKPFVVDISEDTDADVAMIFRDGTYAVYDKETSCGYETIFVSNQKCGDDSSKGLMVFLDQRHLPKYASYNGDIYFFANYSGSTFDLAVVNQSGEIRYYWGLDTGVDVEDFQASLSLGTKSSDEFNIALGIAAKTISFAIIGASLGAAIVAGGTGLIIAASTAVVLQGILEASQSGYIGELDVECYYAINGLSILTSTVSGYGRDVIMSLFSVAFGFEADLCFAEIGQYEEAVANDFANEEWQIKLGTYALYCSPKADTYRVPVQSKALWTYELPSSQDIISSVNKDGDGLVIRTNDYDGTEERKVSVVIKSETYREDIRPVTLTVIQSNILFELSESRLAFTQNGGSKGVYIDKNEQITSWSISYPNWCKIERGESSFFVDVEKQSIENLYGTITVTGYTKTGLSIERKIPVEQIVQSWNGTSWEFEGDVTVSGSGITVTEDFEFTLAVIDAELGTFTSSVPWNSMTLLDDGNLKLHQQVSYSHRDEFGIFSFSGECDLIIVRTGDTRANVTLTGKGKYSDEDGTQTATMKGNFTGTLSSTSSNL